MSSLRHLGVWVRVCSVALFLLFVFLAQAGVVRAESAAVCPYAWTRTLKVGSTGNDVMKLQQFLNADAATVVALSGAGSAGSETTLFGAMTRAAVVRFQEKYAADILTPNGLSSGTGVAAVATRAKLNALCSTSAPISSSSISASSAVSGPGNTLTVSEAQQPAQTLLPVNALYVPFTTFTLAAGESDVTVNNVVIERVGPGSDGMFSDVELLDEDGLAISTAYFRSDHHATFTDSFTIPAGASKTFTLAGDAASDLTDYVGQIAGLQLDSINASAPVGGVLPVRGTLQIANTTLAIGNATAYLSPLDPNLARTDYINDTNITFSAIRVTAGSQEDIRLDSMTWEQNGTASASDVANIVTIVNGVPYPAISDDGRYFTSVFPDPIVIPKGQSVDISVRGDLLVTGANRTVEFDVDSATDVVLYGKTYGYGIYLVPGGNTAMSGNSVFLTDTGDTDGISLSPFFSGSVVTISSGAAVSIGR